MNKFEKGLQTVGKDALKAVESPALLAEYIGRAAKVLDDAVTAEPEVKTVLNEIVKQSTAIAADTTADIAARGLNPVSDMDTLVRLRTFALYIENTVVPLVEKLYGKVKADVQS